MRLGIFGANQTAMCFKAFIIGCLVLTSLNVLSQDPVDVTDQKIKIGAFKEEEIYFGFAAGDKIIFNFQEIEKKELKEIEIIEYPSNSKFSDFKTKQVSNKMFTVNNNAVYIFRFKNSAIGARVCRIQIQRIPANESTKNFNSNVTWVTKQDTVWNTFTRDVIIGYDTTYEQRTKRELVGSVQSEEFIMSKSQRVHSITNGNGSKTSVFFTLPENRTSAFQSQKVISWAYWIGVGDEANSAWKENAKLVSTIVKGGAKLFTSPLGAFAIGAVTDLMIPKIGEDVAYSLTDRQNRDLFLNNQPYRLYDQGKGTAGYKKFTNPALCQGTFCICMENDNMMQGIDADIKVVAIIETQTYEDKKYTETLVSPKYEKQLYKEPTVTTHRMPIISL